ncbi:hypothetical protein MVEN_02415400 [Mycena venus]|uniref:Uncharacterized protein n=1 Tax=Mycena venus TaxID=2733690 RepID=A0A8H6WY12_9AGAR|nr:hypothetical protein MVEN_02415400 [Mycena venus]
MDPSGKENDNKLKQFTLPSKNLLSAAPNDSNQNMARALHPELQGNGLLSGLSAIKPKLVAHSPHSPPSTPCRTPTKLLPDIGSLLASPLNVPAATTCSPSQTSRDRVNDASIHGRLSTSIRTADTNDQDTLNATGETRNGGMTSQQAEAAGEGPGDLPPIAFLREPTASPKISTRTLPAVDRGANAGSGKGEPYAPAGTGVYIRHSKSRPIFIHIYLQALPCIPRSPLHRTRPPLVRAPPCFGSTRRSPPAHAQEPAHPRTSPPPRYRFTYGSLMRHSTTSERTGQNDYGVPVIKVQQELEAACETTPARIGVLRGPPQTDLHAFTALVEELRSGQQDGEGMNVDESSGSGTAAWWVQPGANTAPTVAYAALLDDAFGPGSVLRGDGPKPMDRARKGLGKQSKDRGRSTSSSGGETPDMDVDTDASVDVMNIDRRGSSRAQRWIAKIQVVVNVVQKGKRQLVREDLKSLRDTLREIENMSAAEGNALGDDGPRLRESIWQLAQLKGMPFQDEFPVRRRAKQLFDAWPAP